MVEVAWPEQLEALAVRVNGDVTKLAFPGLLTVTAPSAGTAAQASREAPIESGEKNFIGTL
jgi:hypothetical protein